MCNILQVSRSSFYAWLERVNVVSSSAARRVSLTRQIQAVFKESKNRWGCRRVCAKLNQEGTAVSVGLVRKLMRAAGLMPIQKRAYRKTTVSDAAAQTYRDLVNRDFSPRSHRPGQTLVGDITYLRTGQGWLYLATVIDLSTRMVLGWQMADNMRSALIIDALEMARQRGDLRAGAVFHSDHGSQYTSDDFARYCEKYGFVQSMGGTGVCWDNAVAESFFATLKNEMYYQHTFLSRDMGRLAVAQYIEIDYNRKRPHSALGYQTPSQMWEAKTTLNIVTQVA